MFHIHSLVMDSDVEFVYEVCFNHEFSKLKGHQQPDLIKKILNKSCFESFIIKIVMLDNVGGGSLSKQCLPRRGSITAVVFPKRLKLSVISRAHSALTSFGMGLTYGSSLKPQKPCQGFGACLGSLSRLAQGLLAWSWQGSSAFLCFRLVYISSS